MSDRPRAGNYTCPVCGYLSMEEPPGSNFICSVCYWEDDTADFFDPFPCAGGPNQISLLEAQRNYAEFGASQIEMLEHIREPTVPKDPTWRRIDPARDIFDVERELHSHFTAETLPRGTALYYWSDDYWAIGKFKPLDWHNPTALPVDNAPRVIRESEKGKSDAADPCPCCGYLTFSYQQYPWGNIHDIDICPICLWHDDTSLSYRGADGSLFDAFHRLSFDARPNHVSLIVAQRNFLVFGVSDPIRRQFVRAVTDEDLRDPQWRRVDPRLDVFDSKREFRSADDIVRFELRVNAPALRYWSDAYYLKNLKKPPLW